MSVSGFSVLSKSTCCKPSRGLVRVYTNRAGQQRWDSLPGQENNTCALMEVRRCWMSRVQLMASVTAEPKLGNRS